MLRQKQEKYKVFVFYTSILSLEKNTNYEKYPRLSSLRCPKETLLDHFIWKSLLVAVNDKGSYELMSLG